MNYNPEPRKWRLRKIIAEQIVKRHTPVTLDLTCMADWPLARLERTHHYVVIGAYQPTNPAALFADRKTAGIAIQLPKEEGRTEADKAVKQQVDSGVFVKGLIENNSRKQLARSR